jgi:hypothetical protein
VKLLNTKSLLSISIVLLLVLAAFMTATTTKAQTVTSIPTYSFIIAEPNPIGVGQTGYVDFWLADPTPTAAGPQGDRFSGLMVTITHPDGTTETRGPFSTNDLASNYFTFTPTSLGNYTFQMTFPGQTFADISLPYAASKSNVVVLVVQQQPALSPSAPGPTSYWTRPINGMNLGYISASGNWLMAAWNSTSRAFDDGSTYVGESTAPNSAHILWTTPMSFGGLAGGIYGSAAYYQGMSYEQFFKPPIIIDGRLYFNTIQADEPVTAINYSTVTCVDMATGKTLFTIPNMTLSMGQIYNYVSPNQAGTFAYLWEQRGSTWRMFDAWTGNYILTLANVPTGLTIFSSDGSILTYSIYLDQTSHVYMMRQWNSTRAIPTAGLTGAAAWEWRPYQWVGQTLDAQNATTLPSAFGPPVTYNTNGTMWQVPIQNITGQSLTPFFSQAGLYNGNIFYAAVNYTTSQINNPGYITSNQSLTFIAYDMNTGAYKYTTTVYPPAGLPNDLNYFGSFETNYEFNGVFYSYIKQTLQWTAYNLTTGQQIWISKPYTSPWALYSEGGGEENAYGLYYTAEYDGMVHALNVTNGNQAWSFYTGNSGTLTPYGTWPLYNGITIADGKLFATTGEHGNGVTTMYQGEGLYVMNAQTGTQVWNMSGWFEQPAIADGILVSHNEYDNQIYAFGKGPTTTTVTAPMTQVPAGTSMVIQGTVMDQSQGKPNTPAISDTWMGAWMANLYEQQPLPNNFPCDTAGVQVVITAKDPNNNIINIGTTTSDAAGTYGYTWTPPAVPGTYIITASFAGTNSYYNSYGNTRVVVGQKATASVTSQPISASSMQAVTPNPAASINYILIAIAAAIIILAAVAAVIVVKRTK